MWRGRGRGILSLLFSEAPKRGLCGEKRQSSSVFFCDVDRQCHGPELKGFLASVREAPSLKALLLPTRPQGLGLSWGKFLFSGADRHELEALAWPLDPL